MTRRRVRNKSKRMLLIRTRWWVEAAHALSGSAYREGAWPMNVLRSSAPDFIVLYAALLREWSAIRAEARAARRASILETILSTPPPKVTTIVHAHRSLPDVLPDN